MHERRKSNIKEKKMDIIKKIQLENMKAEPPKFSVGDTVKVHVKVIEGKKERIQIFEGIVLKKQNGGVGETFTVRKISSGFGVERTFLIHSPKIEKVDVVRRGKVRRAKLNYLRDRVGKAAKVKEKRA
jgi:large subunit ribosomal protein L19